MIHCQQCGQANSQTSNFCRFCGTRFLAPPPPPPAPQQYNQQPYQNGNGNYEFSPPRPYMWKTDEFQINDNKTRRQQTQQKNFQPINQVQPLPPPMPAPLAPQPLVFQQQQNLAYRQGCPRCGGQHYPRLEKKISTAGWVVFAVLLVTFFPLFWIGFLIKENQSFCPVCNFRLS